MNDQKYSFMEDRLEREAVEMRGEKLNWAGMRKDKMGWKEMKN